MFSFPFCTFSHLRAYQHPQTTYSTSFLLYHIARHPHIQEKIYEEAINVLPNYDSHELTAEKLSKQLDYSRAVLKEAFRLNPVSVGVGRITNTDLTLGGYNVPKGVKLHLLFFSCSSNATEIF